MSTICAGDCERELRNRKTPAHQAPNLPAEYAAGKCSTCYKRAHLTPAGIEWAMNEARRMMATESFWRPVTAGAR